MNAAPRMFWTPVKVSIERSYGMPLDHVLRRLYVERGMSLDGIVDEFARRGVAVTKSSVSRWLPRLGIAPRSVGNPQLRRAS